MPALPPSVLTAVLLGTYSDPILEVNKLRLQSIITSPQESRTVGARI